MQLRYPLPFYAGCRSKSSANRVAGKRRGLARFSRDKGFKSSSRYLFGPLVIKDSTSHLQCEGDGALPSWSTNFERTTYRTGARKRGRPDSPSHDETSGSLANFDAVTIGLLQARKCLPKETTLSTFSRRANFCAVMDSVTSSSIVEHLSNKRTE